jgi:thiol-disulfide isomerase/thioredoxin
MRPDLLADGVVLRLLMALAFVLIGVLLYKALSRLTLAWAGRRAELPQSENSRRRRPAGATLLYFTTPTCAPCRTIQRPAIQRLQEQVGEGLEVIEIDATQQPDLANRWGVLSVPTTFILDAQGRPRHVNLGVATEDKLLKQIEALN